jgi:hypothetical protein
MTFISRQRIAKITEEKRERGKPRSSLGGEKERVSLLSQLECTTQLFVDGYLG